MPGRGSGVDRRRVLRVGDEHRAREDPHDADRDDERLAAEAGREPGDRCSGRRRGSAQPRPDGEDLSAKRGGLCCLRMSSIAEALGAVNSPETPIATAAHAGPRSAAATTVNTPVAANPRPISTSGLRRLGWAEFQSAPSRPPIANAVTMIAPSAASPLRATASATAAIARPPAPNWLSVPLAVMIASGRWVAMCRKPAAIVPSIEACCADAAGRRPSGIVPTMPTRRRGGHDEGREARGSERGGRGDRGRSADRPEVVRECVDRVGAALVRDALGHEARQPAEDERGRRAGHGRARSRRPRPERGRGTRRPHRPRRSRGLRRRRAHRAVGCGRVRHRRSARRRCSGRAPRRRAVHRARRRRTARPRARGWPR